MNRTDFEPTVQAVVVVAALALSSCAPARRAPDPAPVKPVRAVSAVAADPMAPPPVIIGMPTAPLTRVGGIVVSEDSSARALTIKDYGGLTRTFRIAGDARVTEGGDEAPLGLDGIAAGDKVRLKVSGDVAASVHVMVKPAQ